MITAAECRKLIKEAIKKFGEYNYYDKGPQEVMDMTAIEKRLADMSAEQISKLLLEMEKFPKYGTEFVRSIMYGLDTRQDLDSLYEDERLAKYY